MTEVNAKITESVIRQIMEGTDPRAAIDAALDEKSGYHKEKRIRGGKPTVVNVKNSKRKVHHTLTADQKKAIAKAHTAQANKKRAKSLKKGAKMGLYQGQEKAGNIKLENVNVMSEAEDEIKAFVLTCPGCGAGELDFYVDPETNEKDETLLVCPDCGETFVVVSTNELDVEDDDDEEEDKNDEENTEDVEVDDAEKEVPQDESANVADVAPVSEEAPQECDEPDCGNSECGNSECDGKACGDEKCAEECGEPEDDSELFFEAE